MNWNPFKKSKLTPEKEEILRRFIGVDTGVERDEEVASQLQAAMMQKQLNNQQQYSAAMKAMYVNGGAGGGGSAGMGGQILKPGAVYSYGSVDNKCFVCGRERDAGHLKIDYGRVICSDTAYCNEELREQIKNEASNNTNIGYSPF